jgi:tetratricopeptide (TPR) repeat protein
MDTVTQNMPAGSLNNSAVMYLQAGRLHEAMELFQIALSKLRDQFVEHQESDWEGNQSDCEKPIDQGDDEDQYMECEQDISEIFSKPSMSISVFSSVPVWMPQDTSFLTFYDRALLVDINTPCHDRELLSAVILFNMALLHHSRGITCGKTDCLERASRLYQIALDVLQKQIEHSTNYLLLMAIFNNMAHIDSHLFRMEEMKGSLKAMFNILTSDDIDDDEFALEEDDYTIFFMNAIFGNEKELTVAPAA